MMRKMNRLTTCHLILMAVLIILNAVSAVVVFSGNIPEGYERAEQAYFIGTRISGVHYIINMLALACGIYYVLKGGTKDVAKVYKAFLLLFMLAMIVRMIGRLFYVGFKPDAVILFCSAIILLILAFAKDLGRTVSTTLFGILMALNVALVFMLFEPKEVIPSIAGALTQLTLIGTIGLAIYAKYQDKAARGK